MAERCLTDDGAVAKRKTARPTCIEFLKHETDSHVQQQKPSFEEVDEAGRGLVLVRDSITDFGQSQHKQNGCPTGSR